MKYLFMVIVDEKRLQAMSGTEAQTLDDESLEYDDALRKGGHFLAAQALESVNTAATVRIRSGKGIDHRWTVRRDQGTDRRFYPH